MPNIRNARGDEADQLIGIGMRAWESAIAGWINTGILRQNAERAFSAFARGSYVTIDVVDENGTIVAWAARENLDNHISDLWVDPAWHRHGYGAQLLATLEQHIEAQGYETVTIETHAQNAGAIEFLKSQGYRINWMTATWSPQLDRSVDTVGMIKRLAVHVQAMPYAEF